MSKNVEGEKERQREKTRTQKINKQSSKVKRQRLTNASRLVVKTDYFAIPIISVHLLESESAHFFPVLERVEYSSKILTLDWVRERQHGHGDSTRGKNLDVRPFYTDLAPTLQEKKHIAKQQSTKVLLK